jgi:hypothetical protein
MLRVVYVDHHTLTVLGNEVLSSGRPHAHGDLVTFSGLRWRVHSAGIINGNTGLVETVTLRALESQFDAGAVVLVDTGVADPALAAYTEGGQMENGGTGDDASAHAA